MPDAVLLPQLGVGFAGSIFKTDGGHIIDIPFEIASHTDKSKDKQLALAISELQKAKAVHDELEDIFKAETDFSALTEFTEKYIDEIFRDLN